MIMYQFFLITLIGQKELANNKNIDSMLVFPLSGKPEETASRVKNSLD